MTLSVNRAFCKCKTAGPLQCPLRSSGSNTESDYINLYMHPQAVIVDSSSTEESYFLSGLRDKIRDTDATLIELPENTGQRFSWLSKLDSSALAGKAIH